MNKYTKKLTKTEEEILNFLFVHPTTTFRGRALAKRLNKSVSGVVKSIRNLKKIGLITLEKDFTLKIALNRDNKETFILKRITNLKSLYTTGLVSLLSNKFPGSTIIVFGSYSYGEDTEDSDIDVAILGYPKGNVVHKELVKYNNLLERSVHLHFFDNLKNVDKNLRENIINGIRLKGMIKLWELLENLKK